MYVTKMFDTFHCSELKGMRLERERSEGSGWRFAAFVCNQQR